jgi:glycosyltransferase involved in cell wall biosynthesis
MKRFGIQNLIVTPNGVDASHFCPDAQQNTHQLPERFILFVGSLQPRKNLKVLLDAWSEIKNEYAETWLVIAGEMGNVYNKTELSTNERVHFLGYVAEENLPGLYAKAMVFVLPSFDEGFGLPALEAMACGTPVIVSDGGALPEVIGNAGLMFQLSNAAGLSNAIRECLENRALSSSLVARGLERVKEFSWQNSAELIWNALNEI